MSNINSTINHTQKRIGKDCFTAATHEAKRGSQGRRPVVWF